MRSSALSLLLLLLPACGGFVSGDEELLDEFVTFKARGGQCAAPRDPRPPGGGPLSELSSYRWLVYRGLLAEVVTATGDVRYAGLNADAELLEAARLVTEQAARIDPGKLVGKSEKLAFWVNAYNALVLDTAARELAADDSFRVDKNAFAFFDQQVHAIGEEMFSLNEIENGVIRGDLYHSAIFGLSDGEKDRLLGWHADLWGGDPVDARFHFVINCASQSCPSLLAQPLTGESLEPMMEAATRDFLEDTVRGAGPEGISQIFAFYVTDFDVDGGIDAFVARYRDLAEVNTARFLPYDWGLNAAAN
jgi:hypothetical protein